ncbi:MAG TPA: DUF4421 family protein [Chryseolinea sp.]|nr:DUF4421 family protein [Chryseolinea sp.]
MKFFFFIFFVVPVCWLFAQNSADINADTPNKYDSTRSIYIKTYTDHFFVWPVLKQRRLDYEISDLPEKNRRLLYKSNSPYSLGLGMYIFEVALEFTVAIPLDEKSKEIYGPSDARDLQVTLFTKKWGLDIFRQKYTGFYIDDPSIDIPNNTPYPHRADIVSKNTGVSWSYIFNHKKFSLRSTNNFADRQIKSAGSFILFTTLAGFRTSGDSAIVGDAYRDYYGVDAKVQQIRSTSLSILPGYTYNLVHKGFFLTGTLGIGPSHNWLSYRAEDGTSKDDMAFRAFFVARVALGYSNDRFFTGLTFGTQGGNIKFDSIQLTSSSGTFKLLVGYRFREFGFLKKRLVDLPKAFGLNI